MERDTNKLPHTPGPWHNKSRHGKVEYVNDWQDRLVITVETYFKNGTPDPKMNERNAHLISYLPEIVGFSKQVLSEFSYAGEMPHALRDALNNLQETLTAAENPEVNQDKTAQ